MTSKNTIKHTPKKTSKKTLNKTMHPRNLHTGRYDLDALSKTLPELKNHLTKNPKGEATVNFSNPTAVKLLNKALLMHHYGIEYWDIPDGYLCPPIPSRADYIHHMADLLATHAKANPAEINTPAHVLDIGTGANCIYPIIGVYSYDWQFTATDIDPLAVENAKQICQKNSHLKHKVTVKQQRNADHMFKGIIGNHDKFAFTMCNPPFHSSLEEAIAGNQRKRQNLARHQSKRNPEQNLKQNPKQNQKQYNQSDNQSALSNPLNFGGQKAELWCTGGEIGFLRRMAMESREFATQVGWFSSLVSKAENVRPLKHLLNELNASQIKTIPMQHGQKTTRIIAWTWLY